MNFRLFIPLFPLCMFTDMLLTGVSGASDETLKSVLKKPLITGASVSADWNSKSPGKTLALRYTSPENIMTIAQGGRQGKEMIKRISPSDVKDRSIIIAIDFLFWDSTGNDFAGSEKALRSLMGYASTLNIPIVLGEIPELLKGRQGLRLELNKLLRESCAKLERCVLMPFESIHQQALEDGYLKIQSRKYKLQELLPDGLHLSLPATEFLADLMLTELTKHNAIKNNKRGSE